LDKTYLEPEEITRLEEAATNLRDRLLIRLLYRLAPRKSELLPLNKADIDFDNSVIELKLLKKRIRIECPTCASQLSRKARFCPACGNKVEEVVSKANEQQRLRRLPVDPETLAMLKEFVDRGGPAKDGRLFPIGPRHAWLIVSELAKRAGLPELVNPETGKQRGVSPHRLRDSFATRAVQHDDSMDSLRMLQEHLGHDDINTTMKYRKVAGKEHKEWYTDLSDSLRGKN